MKIMIDAHNLGLKEPTGIGVYAHNLASTLGEMGNEVFALYSMREETHKFSKSASFYQHLAVEGEENSSGRLRWAYHGLPYFLSHCLGTGQSPKSIISDIDYLNKGLVRKLPPNVKPLNLPHIYRVSQAFAAVTSHSLNITNPRELRDLDVLHLTLPLPISTKKTKKVVTMHDVIPFKLPLSTAVNLKHYSNIIKASIKDADLIFSVSEKTKSDLVEIFKFPEQKIHVTYQSSFIPDEILNLSAEDIKPVLARYNLAHKKYFIYYGAIEPKKNVLRLLQAFSKANTDCKLVVLGKNGWLFEPEEMFFETQRYNQPDKQRIIRIPYSDFTEIMSLVKGARALVFPSLYEGFGLPVLEAMQMGTPVITSPEGSLPEVAGDAAHYIDPYSIEDIRCAIEKFSFNDGELKQMTEKGLFQAEKFSSENYKTKLSRGYSKLFE